MNSEVIYFVLKLQKYPLNLGGPEFKFCPKTSNPEGFPGIPQSLQANIRVAAFFIIYSKSTITIILSFCGCNQ